MNAVAAIKFAVYKWYNYEIFPLPTESLASCLLTAINETSLMCLLSKRVLEQTVKINYLFKETSCLMC